MYTIIEIGTFKRCAKPVWADAERLEFITWFAVNPFAGDVIPGSSGLRKVRWSRAGIGKRAGARIIYNTLCDGCFWLLILYTKAKFDNLPAVFLNQLREEVDRGS
ncbi:transcriptional regulator [Pseudomonas sp. KNUC1026]|uniref:transcriptional regulator n=1 Tax=Pseudomonas sp. KNUC1026 TaxID=2893890 RepID=UPI001F2A290D|nr:transcriptional regulator [Pseudomonas sp. KNUC1026]UFH48930.1 transcriptional regulator [Pseudomonas sp. KNUC1026]